MSRLLPLGLLGLLCHLGCQECCNDHDCAVLNAGADQGGDDLCVDGACVEGKAAVVEADGCADCDGAGEQCVDSQCVVAADCLRLDRTFVARLNNGASTGSVVASSDGCEVEFAYDVAGRSNTASVDRIERDGTFTGPVGLDSGSFDNARRTGALVVDAANTITFGTDTYACVVDDDCAGQVFTNCVAPDQDDAGSTSLCGPP